MKKEYDLETIEKFYKKYLRFEKNRRPKYRAINAYRAITDIPLCSKWTVDSYFKLKVPPGELFYDAADKIIYPTMVPHSRCALTGKFYTSKNLVNFQRKKGGKIVQVSIIIARSKLKTKWWFDKRRKVYTAFKFDYDAYSPKYKGSPRFWRQPNKGLYLGFEFELKFPCFDTKINFSDYVKTHFQPFICEKDGSLDGGDPNGPSMEIITNPLHYKDLGKVSNFLQECLRFGGHVPNENYGLHVTVNMSELSPFSIKRFIYAVNYPRLRRFLISLAERDLSSNVKDWAKFEDYPTVGDVSIETFILRHANKDHFYAAYLRPNLRSVELRFFKSTVDFSKIATIVGVVKKIYDWSISSESIDTLYTTICA